MTNENPPMFCLLMTEMERDMLISGLIASTDEISDEKAKDELALLERLEKLPPADKAQLYS